MFRLCLRCCLFATLLIAGGCGQKGALYLPGEASETPPVASETNTDPES